MARPLSIAQHARATLALGLPLVGSLLAQSAIQVTDTVMLGWYGVAELAAVVLAGSFWFTLFIMGSGFAMGLMGLVASAAARDDDAEVRRTTRMALWLSALFAALAMPLILGAEPVLLAAGQAQAVAALADDYLQIAGWGIFPALGVMVLKSYLAALERTQFVLWATVAAVPVNALVNYALIFGNWGAPEMGVRGAALASLTVHGFTFALLCLHATRATARYALFARLWRPDWGGFARVFRIGWPIGLTNLAEVGLFSAAAVMMGRLGTYPLAAHGIAIQIASLTFLVHVGLSNAATVRAGRAFGRGDEAGLRRGALVALGISATLALAAAAVFYAFPEELAGLFLDPADPARPQVIPIAARLLMFAALFQLADAAQVMALGLLRGVQDTRVPMWMAAFSYWGIAIPVSYVLGFSLGYGPYGVWAGLVVGLAAAALSMSVRFWTRSVRIAPAAPADPAG